MSSCFAKMLARRVSIVLILSVAVYAMALGGIAAAGQSAATTSSKATAAAKKKTKHKRKCAKKAHKRKGHSGRKQKTKRCKKASSRGVVEGPQGPAGAAGANGSNGANGAQGDKGSDGLPSPGDKDPASVWIDQKPGKRINEANAAFSFHSDEGGVAFWCQIIVSDKNGNRWTVPASLCDIQGTEGSQTYKAAGNHLRHEGPYTFKVWAVNREGVPGYTTTYDFSIDRTAPAGTEVVRQQPDPSPFKSPTFSFSALDPPNVNGTPGDGAIGDDGRYGCSIDGGVRYDCFSNRPIGVLVDGTHTLSVAAYDSAGNIDRAPATYTWTVDATAPDLTLDAPVIDKGAGTASFRYSSSDASARFKCSLDNAPYSTCPKSGISYKNLDTSAHTFSVIALDEALNESAPKDYSW